MRRHTIPMVVFFNPHSDSCHGPALKERLQELMSEEQIFYVSYVNPREFVQYGLACLEMLPGLGDSGAKETRERLRVMGIGGNRLRTKVSSVLVVVASAGSFYVDLSFNNLNGPLPKFPARSFNIVGNPLVCVSCSIEGFSGSVTLMPIPFSQASSEGKHKSKNLAVALGVSFSCVSLIVLFLGLFWYRKKTQHGAILYIGGM